MGFGLCCPHGIDQVTGVDEFGNVDYKRLVSAVGAEMVFFFEPDSLGGLSGNTRQVQWCVREQFRQHISEEESLSINEIT